MARRFRLKILRILQSCRSKDPSSLPSNPVPSHLRQPNSLHSSLRRHVSSAFLCGLGSTTRHDHPQPQFQWQQEDKYWHVIAADNENNDPRRKIYNSSASDKENDAVSVPPRKSKKKRRVKKMRARRGCRLSTSSADDSVGVLFSDDVSSEETETLVSSSRSFSTDSESVGLETIREAPRGRRKRCVVAVEEEAARLSVFQRMIACRVGGKVRESLAVVKRSEDPYEDFKRSMREMIVEKQMYEEKELEQLLHCFLSLNSRDHHALIVQAFAEIWESMFSTTSTSTRRSCSSSSSSKKTTPRVRVPVPSLV